MTTTITPELQHKIEQEAKDYANLEICDWGKIQGNDQLSKWELANDVYKDAAEWYALKWEQAEARADRYEKALKDFAYRLKEHCEKMGITSIVLQRITIDMEEFTLTPKTSSDDTTNG